MTALCGPSMSYSISNLSAHISFDSFRVKWRVSVASHSRRNTSIQKSCWMSVNRFKNTSVFHVYVLVVAIFFEWYKIVLYEFIAKSFLATHYSIVVHTTKPTQCFGKSFQFFPSFFVAIKSRASTISITAFQLFESEGIHPGGMNSGMIQLLKSSHLKV